MFLKNITDTLDPILDDVLLKNYTQKGLTKRIELDGNVINWNDDFYIYLVSYDSAPHFKPDILSKVNLLNFAITPEGLLDQLISVVVKNEEPKDADEQ